MQLHKSARQLLAVCICFVDRMLHKIFLLLAVVKIGCTIIIIIIAIMMAMVSVGEN